MFSVSLGGKDLFQNFKLDLSNFKFQDLDEIANIWFNNCEHGTGGQKKKKKAD